MTQEKYSKSKNLAPIVLFVYYRPDHTRQTLLALQNNELASESKLFIYSDASINKNSEAKVNEVREYINSINGFKNITIIEREQNWGLANSIINGVTKIVKEYGVRRQDKIICMKCFLNYLIKRIALLTPIVISVLT